jgi:tetratricopeptide (TPR) repeat protein
MKKILLTVIGLWMGVAFAQNSKITSGVLAEQQGQYADAITKLNEAFSNKDILNPKLLAKGYYSLYKSYIQVCFSPDLAELKTQYPDASYRAYEAFQNAMATDIKDRYHKQAILDNAGSNLWAALYNDGVNLFNTDKVDEAMKLFVAADQSKPDDFYTKRMMGSGYLVGKDTAASIATLEKARELFKANFLNSQVEGFKDSEEYGQALGQASFVYQQLAIIYQAQGKIREALNLLTEGAEIAPKEENMKRLELMIYQQHPEMFSEAEAKFKAAIEANPKDHNIKVAYAGLLERAERVDEAFEIYEQVYAEDKENISANYGIGAYYVNKAAAISTLKMKYTKEADIDKADAEILEYLRKAYPYMKWLHEHQPDETEWLRQLVSITSFLGKDAEMKEYSDKLRALSN